jgi:hypothetical protein
MTDASVRDIAAVKCHDIPAAVSERNSRHTEICTPVICTNSSFLHRYPPIDNKHESIKAA